MTRYACSLDEARDLYQQCIIVFYENIVCGRLIRLTSSIKTYLFGIGKNKVREWARGRAKAKSLSPEMVVATHDGPSEEMLKKVEDCVTQLGEPCRSMLIEFYYHRRTIEELKDRFGYKTVESTRNQKYKCLERLRKMVKESQPVIVS